MRWIHRVFKARRTRYEQVRATLALACRLAAASGSQGRST